MTDEEGTDPRARPVVYAVSPDEPGSGTRKRATSVPAVIALWVAVAVLLVGGAWGVVNAINPVGQTGRTPELWLPDPTPVHTNADATRSLSPTQSPTPTPTHREDRPSLSPTSGRGGHGPGRHDDRVSSGSPDDHGGRSGGSGGSSGSGGSRDG